MTNITPVISSILVERHASDPIPDGYHTSATLDTFLQEAYRINAHISSLLSYLRQIRQPYLSTAPPPRHRSQGNSSQITYLTDPQRSEIDSSTSLLLRDLSANISSLSTAESLRASTETALLERKYGKPSGAFWRWAGGGVDGDDEPPKSKEQRDEEGRAQTLKMARESVLWYLSTELGRAAERQRGMVEVRVEREREKEKSILWKMGANADPAIQRSLDENRSGDMNGSASSPTATTTNGSFNHNPAADPNTYNAATSASIESQLTPEQLQLFAAENSTLLNHYNDTLSKVTQAEKSVLEIATLQQTLMGHLGIQGELIDQLVSDAQNTDENVRRGNRELKTASERASTARLVFWVTVGLCGFLVGWDLVF